MSSKPNWGRPLALAAVLVVLGSLSYWLVYTHKPKEDEQDEQSKKIAQLSSDQGKGQDKAKGKDAGKDRQIQTITLDNGTGTRLSVACLDVALQVCKPGSSPKWEMAEPLKVKADDSNINAFISTLNNLNASDTISLKDETPEKKVALLKEYGLDPAAVAAGKTRSIQVETTTGNLGLYLGQQHPIGDGTFVVVEHTDAGKKLTGQFDQNQVYVIPSFIKTNFDKPTNFWREKKLLTIGSHDVAAFHLKGTHADVEGTLQNGQWTLRSQTSSKTGSKIEELPGDVESIDNMLNGVAFLVARDFASDNKTDAKAKAILHGARPIITLSMEKAKPATPQASPSPGSSGTPAAATSAEQSTPIVLTLFAKDAHKEKNGVVQVRLFATVSNQDPLYEVESFAKDRMDKEVKELRLSKLITSMDRFTAKKLMFEGGSLSNPIRLAMKDSKWTDSDNPQTTIDSERVQSLLDKLAGDKVQEFIPLTKAPADVMKGESTGLTLSLGDETSAAKRKIVFWKVVDNSPENPKDKSSGKGKKGAGFKLYAHDLNSPRKEIFLMDSSAAQGLPWEKNSFVKAI
jgi:hypothetical protein